MSAPRATIVINLPAHRHRALELVDEGLVAEQAYDKNIGGYIEFLRQQAEGEGYIVQTSRDEQQPVFRLDETSHDDKKAARGWLETLPDIWNWMPSA